MQQLTFWFLMLLCPMALAGPLQASTGEAARQLLEDKDGSLTRPGWTWTGTQADSSRYVYEFSHDSGIILDVVLEAKDDQRSAYTRTRYCNLFHLELKPTPPQEMEPEIDQMMKAVSRVVSSNENPGLIPQAITSHNPEIPEGQSDDDPAGHLSAAGQRLVVLDSLLLLCSLFGLVLLLVLIGRHLRRRPLTETLSVLVLLVIGVLIRLLLIPLLPVKVGMVYPLMDAAVGLDSLPRYGAAGPVLYHMLFTVFPVHIKTILVFHSIVEVINGLLLVMILHRVLETPRAGPLAAFFLAFTPLFWRDANSESLLVPATFFLTGGTLLVIEYLRDDGRVNLLGALPLLAFGLHLRPEMVLMVPLFLGCLAGPFVKGGKRWQWTLPLVGVLTTLAIPYLLWLQEAVALEMARGNIGTGDFSPLAMVVELFQRNLLIRPKSLPLVLPILALAALILGWQRREQRVRPFLIAGLATIWMTIYYMDFNEESMLRLHAPPARLISVLAAAAVIWGLDKLSFSGNTTRLKRYRLLITSGIVGLFLLSALPTGFFVFFQTNSYLQYSHFDKLAAALPDEAVNVITLTGADRPNRAWSQEQMDALPDDTPGRAGVHRFFPSYLLQPPHRNDRVLSISEYIRTPPNKGRNFFYLSPQCFAVQENHGYKEWNIEPDPTLVIHPACRWMLMHHDLEPVLLEWLSNQSEYSPSFQWYRDDLSGLPTGLLEVKGKFSQAHSNYTFYNLAGQYFARAKTHMLANEMDQAGAMIDDGRKVLRDISITFLEHEASYAFLRGTHNRDKPMLRHSLDNWLEIARRDIHYPMLLKNLGSVFSVYSEFADQAEVHALVDGRLEAQPDDVIGNWLKGMLIFYNEKDYALSLRHLDKVLSVVSDDPRVYVYITLNHYYMGHQKEAEQWIAKGISIAQDRDPDVYYVRSIVIRKKNLPLAIEDIRRYLKASKGADKVKFARKQEWLRQELENLKEGKMSPWWTSGAVTEPWNKNTR